MDFFARLLGATKRTPKKATISSPQHRLHNFTVVYQSLLKIWKNGAGVSKDAFVAENVRICIHRLTDLLNEDLRGPTPHQCITFSASHGVLRTIAHVGTAFQDDGITHEALAICGLLLDNEEEKFLEDRLFADALPAFIESIQQSMPKIVDADMESSMVELLFAIASNIRVKPLVLRTWFRPEPYEDDEDAQEDELSRRTPLEEFPIFYHLLYYVPHEGRAGDFARMGLLYIIESTSYSQSLERWLVEGDMAALMASGLGALYSQLSRKLTISYPENQLPPILRFSDRQQIEAPSDAEPTTSSSYQAHLATFLASLLFWQDLLEHCASSDVKQTLLDHFQFLFLQQLLYPSLLESSDVDGGSSVAVLTYLRHILESIDHPDLVRLTLLYLFGLKGSPQHSDEPSLAITKARRRKSENLMARLAKEFDQPSPDLFNLGDLITTSLLSQSQQTVAVTLQLLSTMFRRQHLQTVRVLLRTRPAHDSDNLRTFGGQQREVNILISLAENLTGFSDLEDSYEKHLHDSRNTLEHHPCTMQLLGFPLAKAIQNQSNEHAMEPHILLLQDPTFKALIALMDNFFSHDIETNLGLTQVVLDIAACGFIRLEGWLVTKPSKYIYPANLLEAQDANALRPIYGKAADEDEDGEAAALRRVILARCEPSWKDEDKSPISQTLDQLLQKVESFQREMLDFDVLLSECRKEIEGDATEWPRTPSTLSAIQDSGRLSPLHSYGAGSRGHLLKRLREERASDRSPQYEPPRGRQLEPSPTPSPMSRLHHLQVSPSPSPSPSMWRTGRSTRGVHPTLKKTPAVLQRKIRVTSGDSSSSDVSRDSSVASTSRERETEYEDGQVSIGHLLTNVIILQEFVLELASLIDVRATIFGEVRYD